MRATVRAARADEASALRAIAEEAFAPSIERIGRRPAPMDADFAAHIARGEVWAAEADGLLVGYVVLLDGAGALQLENVATVPDARGAGVGRALLTFAEGEARRRGFSAVELYTNAKMTENLALYPSIGYEEIGRGVRNGFDRVFYRKRLAPRDM